MRTPITVTIRSDASPTMGTGHVMRCLALALAARESGLGVRMIGRVQVPWVRERLQKEGINFTVLAGDVPERERPEDLLLQIQDTQKPDWIILDGYHFGPDCQNAVRQAGYRLLVIDDYNHLPEYHADILLNQNLGAEEFDYRGDVGQKLLGPRYALLRPEFALARKQAEKRIFPEKAQKLLLTLGGGDFSTHLLDIAPVLSLPELADCTLRVISGAMPKEEIRKALTACPATLEILPCVGDMPALLLDTDLCITAGGSTCWELCCLGVPFLTVAVAINQRGVIAGLERARIAFPFSAPLLQSVLHGRQRSLRQSLMDCVDGYGAARAAGKMLKGPDLYFRQALPEDCDAVYALANDSLVRSNAFFSDFIPKEEHDAWFARRLSPGNGPFFLFFYEDILAGYVRYDIEGAADLVVTLAVSEKFRGRKLGIWMLDQTGKHVLNLGFTHVTAWVKLHNIASQKIFTNAGYMLLGLQKNRGKEMLCFQLRLQ